MPNTLKSLALNAGRLSFPISSKILWKRTKCLFLDGDTGNSLRREGLVSLPSSQEMRRTSSRKCYKSSKDKMRLGDRRQRDSRLQHLLLRLVVRVLLLPDGGGKVPHHLTAGGGQHGHTHSQLSQLQLYWNVSREMHLCE